MGGSSEAGTNASSSLLGRKKGNYRDHYVNGLPFTICMSTFAVLVAGSVAVGASMLVAGGVKEAQDLAPPVDQSLHSKVYGAKHAGVGFANYVVGNEVSKFWTSEMGGKAQKMTDPFSFLRKGTKKKQSGDDDDTSSDTSDGSSSESPERQADDAQPVDTQHHRIAGAPATDLAIQHAQDVAQSHSDEDMAAEKGREHLLRLLRTGRSSGAGASPPPHLHHGMFHERHSSRGRHTVRVPSDEDMQGIQSAAQHARAARGDGGAPQKLHEDAGSKLVVTAGKGGIPVLHIAKGGAASASILRTTGAVSEDDNAKAMETLHNAQKDLLQKTPGHVEPVKKAAVAAAQSGLAAQPPQGPNESYFHYKWRISH